MKKYILSATTNSEWDSCSFAIVTINEETLQRIKKAKEIIESKAIDKAVLFSCEIDFFLSVDDLPESIELDKDFEVIEKEIPLDFNTDEFTVPGNSLSLYEIAIYATGVYFNATGKHTGEEFYCTASFELLGINELITH